MRIDPAMPAPGTRLHRFRELFVAPEDRWALQNRLWLAGGWHEPQEYDLRLEPRRRAAAPVRATVDVVRERSGDVRELRWLLHQRRAPVATEPVGRALAATRAAAGRPAVTARGPAGRDDLASVLEEVVAAAATLLHADGAGLMLLYEDGGLRWVTATGHQWSEADVGAMRAYATVLDRLLATATDASRKRELADQLQQALDRRVLIEQAKGMLMARMGLGADQAFALIRREARSRNRRVADVARDVIDGHLPEPLEPRR